jgi:hypothetical protein
MSTREQSVVTWSIGWVCLSLCAVVATWGIYPLYGDTLVHQMSSQWNLPFKVAAFAAASMVAILGVLVCLAFSCYARLRQTPVVVDSDRAP